jgi:hypothetical protein
MLLLRCPECRDDRTFEQPLCDDGHGVDCPEWLCVECGYGMLLATYPEIEQPGPVPALVTVRRAA